MKTLKFFLLALLLVTLSVVLVFGLKTVAQIVFVGILSISTLTYLVYKRLLKKFSENYEAAKLDLVKSE